MLYPCTGLITDICWFLEKQNCCDEEELQIKLRETYFKSLLVLEVL